ncbi:MAG TPA: hypothetical protein VG711_09525 [Phycisphaerales bacterium]|nr:hypothetical protein [Phycisphaerales bacterium]
MNIKTSEVFEFTVREDEGPQYPMHDVDASWTPDSSMCVLPPPAVNDRRVIIKFSKGEKPSVSFLPDPGDLKPGETLPQLPQTFACSDCFPHTDDFELLKKHIAKEFLFVGSITPNEDEFQIVSPDGTKIYYQKGPQGVEPPDVTHATTLYELDVATGAERRLVVHEGDCPIISHLRPSPDGKKLAYQVTTGCGFIGVPQIYVLDLAAGKPQSITFGDGTMHWSSTSDKLYFYRRWVNENPPPGDYIWVAEFPSQSPASQPAASQPRPATPPAESQPPSISTHP